MTQHPTPTWFEDAKFGIYAHWGPSLHSGPWPWVSPPTSMPLGMNFEGLGSGKAPNICVLLHPDKKQILGALPDPSTSRCIPKGILVGSAPRPGL